MALILRQKPRHLNPQNHQIRVRALIPCRNTIGFGIAETGESAVRAALQKFLEFNPMSRRVRASMFLGRLHAELLERHDLPGYLELGKFLEDVVRERHPNLVSDLPA